MSCDSADYDYCAVVDCTAPGAGVMPTEFLAVGLGLVEAPLCHKHRGMVPVPANASDGSQAASPEAKSVHEGGLK